MNEHEKERIEKVLRKTLPSVGALGAEDLRRDLWPTMLARLDAQSAAPPWFDWALLAVVVAWLVFFPGAIPVLFYHL